MITYQNFLKAKRDEILFEKVAEILEQRGLTTEVLFLEYFENNLVIENFWRDYVGFWKNLGKGVIRAGQKPQYAAVSHLKAAMEKFEEAGLGDKFRKKLMDMIDEADTDVTGSSAIVNNIMQIRHSKLLKPEEKIEQMQKIVRIALGRGVSAQDLEQELIRNGLSQNLIDNLNLNAGTQSHEYYINKLFNLARMGLQNRNTQAIEIVKEASKAKVDPKILSDALELIGLQPSAYRLPESEFLDDLERVSKITDENQRNYFLEQIKERAKQKKYPDTLVNAKIQEFFK